MKRLVLTACLSLVSTCAYAGIDVGNGGDLVKCVPHEANDLFGFYSLDYLIFARSKGPQPMPAQSWEESIFRIRRTLVDKIPELLPIFDEFANNILNEDQSRRQVWEPTDYELREINDEDLPASVQIPVNCRDGGKIQLVQAVIRQKPEFTGSNLIVYKYMPRIFEKMAKERPLQLSFLLVHEFLWSISDNVDRNRRINWFFHSEEFQKMSRLDAINRLLSMGLNVLAIPRIVDASGLGHFTSLQEAIQKSRDGETLLLKEGIYSMAGTMITHSLNLIGDGKPGKTIIKGGLSDPALKLALEPKHIVRIENLMLSRMAEFSREDYQSSRAIDFATPGTLILKNVIVRSQGKFLIDLVGTMNLHLENVIFEGRYAFWMGDYVGTTRIQNTTLISRHGNPNWFWDRGEIGNNVQVVSCRNQIQKFVEGTEGRIWEDWDTADLNSYLQPDPTCKPIIEGGY